MTPDPETTGSPPAPSAPADDVAKAILTGIRRLTYATIVLYGIVFAVVAGVWVDSGNKADALERTTDQTTAALCTFRADVKSRADATAAYLEAHPEGFPGVTPEQLRQGLDGQRRTVKALRKLNCPRPTPTPVATPSLPAPTGAGGRRSPP